MSTTSFRDVYLDSRLFLLDHHFTDTNYASMVFEFPEPLRAVTSVKLTMFLGPTFVNNTLFLCCDEFTCDQIDIPVTSSIITPDVTPTPPGGGVLVAAPLDFKPFTFRGVPNHFAIVTSKSTNTTAQLAGLTINPPSVTDQNDHDPNGVQQHYFHDTNMSAPTVVFPTPRDFTRLTLKIKRFNNSLANLSSFNIEKFVLGYQFRFEQQTPQRMLNQHVPMMQRRF